MKLNRTAVALVSPLALVAAAVGIPGLGCNQSSAPVVQTKMLVDAAMPTAVVTISSASAAATQPANQHVAGTVTFTQEKEGVKAVVDLTGLAPGKHGIHIHEKTDMSAPDLSSAGGHWDPDGHKQHGGPTSEADKRHAGDLGNLVADAEGKAHYEVSIAGVSIGGKNDIVGHSVIVHAKEDDMKSNPAGNAGGRVAGGAIKRMD